MHSGIVFATAHIVGATNGMEPFPNRAEGDDLAAKRRTEAAAAWLREAFTEARASQAPAVVLGIHGNPILEKPADDPERLAFEPFITALEEEVEAFGGPVLLVHGDDHEYIVDRSLVRRTNLRRLQNLTRMQVPGSPEVGWVRVVVTPGADEPFAFEEHVVPPWKYW